MFFTYYSDAIFFLLIVSYFLFSNIPSMLSAVSGMSAKQYNVHFTITEEAASRMIIKISLYMGIANRDQL